MGTTRIKVIDLSSDQKEIKTSRKHAEKLSSLSQAKKAGKKPNQGEKTVAKSEPRPESRATTETTEKRTENQSPEAQSSAIITGPTDITGNTELTENTGRTDTLTHTDSTVTPKPSVPSAVAKKRTHHKGAKYRKAASLVEEKDYTLKEALVLLPQTSFTKFDPSVEVHLNVTEKNLKATVNMPHLKAEKKEQQKYLIFSDRRLTIDDKHVLMGDEKTIADIEAGSLKPGRDFTAVAASPKFMPILAKIAKILGPKGMMPNPKNGTVTENFEKLLNSSGDSRGLSIKTDPTAPIIHTKIGKLSQKQEELEANFKALVTSIGSSKIKKAAITTTMGPAIRLDPTKLIAA